MAEGGEDGEMEGRREGGRVAGKQGGREGGMDGRREEGGSTLPPVSEGEQPQSTLSLDGINDMCLSPLGNLRGWQSGERNAIYVVKGMLFMW